MDEREFTNRVIEAVRAERPGAGRVRFTARAVTRRGERYEHQTVAIGSKRYVAELPVIGYSGDHMEWVNESDPRDKLRILCPW